MTESQVDVLVVGGGLGGVAAAHRAASMGARTMLVEPGDWLGGQVTSQGLSVLDEHSMIESFGASASYYEFRRRVRGYYRSRYGLVDNDANSPAFNPGSRGKPGMLAFEPRAALEAIGQMLAPLQDRGVLQVRLNAEAREVEYWDGRIAVVRVAECDGNSSLVFPKLVIDATELGDLLALAGAPYVTGAEAFAETLEPSAPALALPEASQAFSYTFALEHCPGESHVIPKPEGYDECRRASPFTFNGFLMFSPGKFSSSFWQYRRILDAANFADPAIPRDVAVINWLSTDYSGGTIVDQPTGVVRAHLDRARRLALSFLYWLQTEAPRDEGGAGYPELKLRHDIMGTPDGLSKHPYIREGRRLLGVSRVREQDITERFCQGPRARPFHDAVGIGYYPYIDIHRCHGTKARHGSGQRVLPYQVPLGAMVCRDVPNLVAGAKNLGTTHITNGAYRMHPTEWATGEAAGAVCALAARLGSEAIDILCEERLLRTLQIDLLRNHVPLFWYPDVPHTHAYFGPVHFLAVQGLLPLPTLQFEPDQPVTGDLLETWVQGARHASRLRPSVVGHLNKAGARMTRGEFAAELFAVVKRR